MGPDNNQISAAEMLWSEYWPAIHRTLFSYEADPHLREDLAQDVFLAVLSSVDRIQAASNRRAYLFRIVHNVAMNHIAGEVKRNWIELGQEPGSDDQNPERLRSDADRHAQLMLAVRKLKLPYRQVMVLVLEDFDHSEIAEVLGIRDGTVRIRVNRAKHKLRELLHHE